jgi:hypothetical protein
MARYYGEMLSGQAATAMDALLNALPASSPLFIVNGTMDLTTLIEVPSYQVNLEDVYEEWTDNNQVTHRDTIAKKAKGSFNVRFESVDQYQAFMMYLKNNKKQNASYDCSVYLNNMLEAINTEMFIDFAPENFMPYIGVKEYDSIEVTVEQRGNQYIV